MKPLEKSDPELGKLLSRHCNDLNRPLIQMMGDQMFMQRVRASNKIPRNARCPCGSGKKYKRCCLN